MAKGEVLEALDHPVFFLVVITIGVMSLMAIFKWAGKATGLQGLAAVAGG